MAPHAYLSDQEIADVLTYVRNSFGNKGDVIVTDVKMWPTEMKKAEITYNGKRVLFIDRDGTLINEAPPTYQLDSFDKLTFYPHMFEYMGQDRQGTGL